MPQGVLWLTCVTIYSKYVVYFSLTLNSLRHSCVQWLSLLVCHRWQSRCIYTLAYSLHYAGNFKSLYENLIKISFKSKASLFGLQGQPFSCSRIPNLLIKIQQEAHGPGFDSLSFLRSLHITESLGLESKIFSHPRAFLLEKSSA